MQDVDVRNHGPHLCDRKLQESWNDHFYHYYVNHRKEWIRERLNELSGIFGLEVYAYAVMSNHQHVVLRADPKLSANWTAKEVMQRWGYAGYAGHP